MKIISKILTRIFLIAFVFLVVNLAYGCFKYDGVKNYMQILNEKDWDTSIGEISISDPISIFSLFSSDSKNEENVYLEVNQEKTSDSANLEEEMEQSEISTGSNDMDPYDPEFEDEFNSFFGSDESGENLDQTQNKENDLGSGSFEDLEEDKSSVGEQLVEKFNE
ncbi:MAG TPA: hypothetical protein VJ892_00425 [Candidatus Absconditabacterales bacterium]|nr:hypothetical protein [Candidatus Absconditabacterales bacterium]